MRGSPRGRRPRSALPSGSARERLAENARGRRGGDDRDEPSARECGRVGGVPGRWQRRRRRACGRRRADRRRADRQRDRRRRVRDRLARRRPARAERLGSIPGGDRPSEGRRLGAALRDGARRRACLGRPGGAVRPARPGAASGPGVGALEDRHGLHGADRRQVVARGPRAVSRAAPGRAIRDPGARGDTRADRDGRPRRSLHR